MTSHTERERGREGVEERDTQTLDREPEAEADRHRERDRQADSVRVRVGGRARARERGESRQRDRQGDGETESVLDRLTHRPTNRQTDRQKADRGIEALKVTNDYSALVFGVEAGRVRFTRIYDVRTFAELRYVQVCQ